MRVGSYEGEEEHMQRLRPLARVALALAAVMLGGPLVSAGSADEVRAKFEYLSQNGNSNCSMQFMESIPELPEHSRLQGSCCSPMDLHRYEEQVAGLEAYSGIDLIPSDPYDIPAPLAARLMQLYGTALNSEQQAAYDFAMTSSNEGGPCCCGCWRWAVYGGLAKHLIRDREFDGEQVAEIWDLSDGCGGTDHVHS